MNCLVALKIHSHSPPLFLGLQFGRKMCHLICWLIELVHWAPYGKSPSPCADHTVHGPWCDFLLVPDVGGQEMNSECELSDVGQVIQQLLNLKSQTTNYEIQSSHIGWILK